MKKTIIYILIALYIVIHPVSCYATDLDEVEELLSPFQPKEITGSAYDETSETCELVESDTDRGGIIAFDVAENGNIAIITGDRDYLTIYDSGMDILNRYNPKFQIEGVRYLGDMLLLFGKNDICAVYDANKKLVAIYDICPATEDIHPYEKYESIARENPKRQGDYYFYKSDRIKRPPTVRLGKKHQSMFLVRVDNEGNRTVLLNRSIYRLLIVVIVIVILVAIVFINLCWLNDKYHLFEKIRKHTEHS